MLSAPSSTRPSYLPSPESKLTIPDRPPHVARRHSTLSPLRTSRPLRSSPLAGPSLALGQDGTLNVGAASAPPSPGGNGRHLSPLPEFSTVSQPGGDDDVMTPKHRRRRTLGAVFTRINFPSSASSLNSSSSSTASLVPDHSTGNPRRRVRSASAHDPPPVPPMPAWAQNAMPNLKSQSLPPSPSPTRSYARARPGSSSTPSSRPSSPSPSPSPSSRSASSRRSMIQAQIDGRAGPGSPIAGRIPPSTSRNPDENWLTQAAPPRFSRLGLKAQGVVMPVSAHEARRRSTMSTASIRTKSLDVLTPLAPAHTRASSRSSVASTSTHGRIPRRPATSPASGLSASSSSLSPTSRLRSRTSSLASASSSHASIDRCVTPPLTMSSATSTSSVSFADPPMIIVGTDDSGVQSVSSSSGVQIHLNDVPVPPEAYHGYDLKGKGKRVAVEVSSVASAGSIGSIVSQTSYASGYSAYSGSSVLDTSYSSRHVSAVTAPAEMQVPIQVQAQDPVQDKTKATISKKRSTIGRVWKQVVRSVTVRR